MKKLVFFLSAGLAALALSVFGYMNWRETAPEPHPAASSQSTVFPMNWKKVPSRKPPLDLVYKVEPRFATTISRDSLRNATSVLDVVPEDAITWKSMPFETVKVALFQTGEEETYAMGKTKEFNADQAALLHSLDYSDHFFFNAWGKEIDTETGRYEMYAYYFTVVPEYEAEYPGGMEALVSYLQAGTREAAASITQDKLRPGRVFFTVNRQGQIDGVRLDSSCGYPEVDETLTALVSNMPGTWQPATNAEGEAVEQELVFFFGVQGC